MPEVPLHCDQAIFTSVRTPMGEGYRVIAAGKGIKPNEKQAITRNSPSHDALCADLGDAQAEGPLAAAFYLVDTGRLALSVSGFAGSEHTGRGGGRVYTTIVVFAAEDFARCGYNPFHVLRAMLAAGACEPQLQPPAVLPELTLTVSVSEEPRLSAPPLVPNVRVQVLRNLFDGKNTVVNMPGRWLETAEALLLALPGPLRADVSFSAGMHFSMSRMHHLELLFDDKGKARLRTTGQKVQYVDSESDDIVAPPRSAWFDFVERCYAADMLTKLARRTSRAYDDCTLEACDRIGHTFEVIEQVPQMDCPAMLEQAAQSLDASAPGVEAEAHAELQSVLQRHLLERLAVAPMPVAEDLWHAVLVIWRAGGAYEVFARPLVVRMAAHLAQLDPLTAALVVADIVGDIDRHPEPAAFASMIDEVLSRFLLWSRQSAPDEREQAVEVARRWQQLRPDSDTASQIVDACELQPATDAPNT